MRVSSIKLDSNGRAHHVGEVFGFCLVPLAALAALYPVTVRTRDGDELEVQGPHAFDFGRETTFDIRGTAGAQYQLVTFTRPGEAFAASFIPPTAAAIGAAAPVPPTAAAIGAAVAAPGAYDIANANANRLTPKWVELWQGTLSEIVGGGSDLGVGAHFFPFDATAQGWNQNATLEAAIANVIDAPEAEAWRVTALAQGGFTGAGTLALSIVSGWSPEVLAAVGTMTAETSGCGRVARLTSGGGEAGLVLKAVVSGASLLNIEGLRVVVDCWRIPAP